MINSMTKNVSQFVRLIVKDCVVSEFHNYIFHVSQPTLRREGNAGLAGASSKKGKCTKSPPTFIRGKRQKNQKRCVLRILSVKGSRVVFTHREGISTPRICHKRRQP